MYVCMYVCMCMYVYVYIYIYIHIDGVTERERERGRVFQTSTLNPMSPDYLSPLYSQPFTLDPVQPKLPKPRHSLFLHVESPEYRL